MPQAAKRKSPITLLAIIMAGLLGILIAYHMIMPRGDAAAPTTDVAAMVDSAPEAVGTPAPPAPTPEATPVASPEPTPQPTPESTPESTPEPTPSPSPTPIPPVIKLSGFLMDSLGEPVAGGRLYILRRLGTNLKQEVIRAFSEPETHWIVTTNGQGAYEIELPAGDAYIAGIMVDDEPQPFVQQVAETEAGSEISADFSLPRPVEIRGQVADETNRTIADIPLVVEYETKSLLDRPVAPRILKVTTDDTGRYSVRLHEPAEISVTVDSDALPDPWLYDREPVRATENDFGATRSYRVDLKLETGISIIGTVTASANADIPGSPISNATVSLREQVDPRSNIEPRFWRTVSDETGGFEFPRVNRTVYNLVAEHPDYNTGRISAYDAALGEPARMELEPFGVISGTITAEPTSEGRGWIALVNSAGEELRETISVRPGVDCAFTFRNVKPGIYDLIIEVEEGETTWYHETSLTLEPGASARFEGLALEPLCAVRGKLLTTVEYTTPGKVTIVAEPMEGDNARPLVYASPASTRRKKPASTATEEGDFIIENIQPDLTYLIRALDRETRRELGSAIVRGCEGGELRILLGGTGSISGVVRNKAREACEGKIVEVTTGLGTLAGESADVQVRRARVSYDGTYELRSLPVGTARIALADDERTVRLISIAKDENLTLNFECTIYVAIRFTFEKDDSTPLQPGEQLLVIPKPGTESRFPVRELSYGNTDLELEPGSYSMTRTRTMQSVSFEVNPRFDTTLHIDFTEGTVR